MSIKMACNKCGDSITADKIQDAIDWDIKHHKDHRLAEEKSGAEEASTNE